MATIVKGVMTGNIPWLYIIVGVMLASAIELVGISSLPFAIGLYLPLELSTPIMAGGLIALFVGKVAKEENLWKRQERGILFSSGLVAGDALVGVLIAFLVAFYAKYRAFYELHEETALSGSIAPWLALAAFGVIAIFLWRSTVLPKIEKR
jgi:uncharacterized oligopeptide transporter (OPT) family protein